jgi:hypothetical protein
MASQLQSNVNKEGTRGSRKKLADVAMFVASKKNHFEHAGLHFSFRENP